MNQPTATEDVDWAAKLEIEFMTEDEFAGLLEYTTTLPTGKTIGKRWKRYLFAGPSKGQWVMGEYVDDPNPEYVGITWRRIVVMAVLKDVAERAEGMCDWTANFNEAQASWTHDAFHFGNECPYRVVAEILRGRPDPRRVETVQETLEAGR